MSNVIRLLEKLASDSKFQSEECTKQEIANAEIPEEVKHSILQKDSSSLERQLDVTPDIVCFVIPAEDDESPDESGEENKETNILVNA